MFLNRAIETPCWHFVPSECLFLCRGAINTGNEKYTEVYKPWFQLRVSLGVVTNEIRSAAAVRGRCSCPGRSCSYLEVL